MTRKKISPVDSQNVEADTASPGLVSDIRRLIVEAKTGLAATVNSALKLLYWHIGQRIRSEVLKGERAGYGEQIVTTLARQLEAEHGRGFSTKNLRHMLHFAEVFEIEEIVYALSRQLSWTHLRSLIYIDDPLKRDFYLEMCRSEGWSTRTLQGRLDSMLFERTALSRKPDELLVSELAALREQGDLFHLGIRDIPTVHHSFGTAGSGMQEAVSVDPDLVIGARSLSTQWGRSDLPIFNND